MPASSDTFTFTGQATTGWYAYRDAATGSMLVAEPGGTYQIQALDPAAPVPPDARWVPGTARAAKATAAGPGLPEVAGDTGGTAPAPVEGSGT